MFSEPSNAAGKYVVVLPCVRPDRGRPRRVLDPGRRTGARATRRAPATRRSSAAAAPSSISSCRRRVSRCSYRSRPRYQARSTGARSIGVSAGTGVVRPISATWPDVQGRFQLILPASVAGKTLRFWQSDFQTYQTNAVTPGGPVDLKAWPTALSPRVAARHRVPPRLEVEHASPGRHVRPAVWCDQCSAARASIISPAVPACSRLPSSFPARGCERRHTRTRAPAPSGSSPPSRGVEPDVPDAVPQVPPLRDRLAARPHLARRRARAGADLVLDRPAGRQPGARQPDGRRSQAAVLRPPDRARDQGDRGRLPVGLEDGLRLRAHPRRPGPDSGRRHDRRAHAGAARADRAHLRVDRRCAARDRPPLQLHLGHAAAGRLPPRPRRHHRPGGSRHDALQAARGRDGDRDRLPVLARELPPHRAGLRARDLRAGRGGVGADAGGEDDRQPADDGRAVPPERLRRPDGVVRTALLVPRRRRSCPSTRTTTAAPRSPRPSSG